MFFCTSFHDWTTSGSASLRGLSAFLCNATSSDVLIADYTYRVDEERWPPYFTVLAQYHMASIFAAAVARSAKLQELFLTQYATQLRTAKSIDGQGQTTRRVITNRFRNFRHSSSSLG